MLVNIPAIENRPHNFPAFLPTTAYGRTRNRRTKTRAEIANYLRDLADQLDSDGDVTLDLGGATVQLNPTNPIMFKVEGESDWSHGDTEAKQSIEFELVWWRDASTPDEGRLEIQD